MSYNSNPNINLQQQLQDLTRQYQQLLGQAAFPVQTPTITQVPIPIPVRQIQYVEGIQGARLYQDNMQANSSEIIVDKDEDVFYKVSKDANGIPSKKIVRCSFTVIDELDEEPTYLTRRDFDEFKEEIRQLLTPQSKTTTTSTALKTTTSAIQKKT